MGYVNNVNVDARIFIVFFEYSTEGTNIEFYYNPSILRGYFRHKSHTREIITND